MTSIPSAPGDDKGERTIWLQDNGTLTQVFFTLYTLLLAQIWTAWGIQDRITRIFFFYCSKESTVRRFCLTKHPTVQHTMCALCKLISCRAKKTRQAWKKTPQDNSSPQYLLVLYSAHGFSSIGTTFTESRWECLDTNAFVSPGRRSAVSLESKVPALLSHYGEYLSTAEAVSPPLKPEFSG